MGFWVWEIAIANSFLSTISKVKNKGVQEYILRTNEKARKERRHSSFFVGLSMIYWAINDDFHEGISRKFNEPKSS